MNTNSIRQLGVFTATIVVAFVISTVGPDAQSKPELDLKAAMDKEVADGDLKGAIAIYLKLANGTDRVVAAKALIRLGQSYEKLGRSDARTNYERVIKEFADQKEAVADAQRRLAVEPTGSGNEVALQLVWKAHDDRQYAPSISRTGRIPFTRKEGLYLFDLMTGREQLILTGADADGAIVNEAISSDGTQIAYQAGPKLFVVGVDGARPRAVVGDANTPALMVGWRPGARELMALTFPAGKRPRDGQWVLVSVKDGSSRVLPTPPNGNNVSFSPDGRYFTFPVRTGEMIQTMIQPIDGAPDQQTPVFGAAWTTLWTPDGSRALGAIQRSPNVFDLWATPIVAGKPAGPATQVYKDIPRSLFGPTDDGRYFYQTRSVTRDIYTLEVDAQTGAATSIPKQLTSQHDNGGAAWSPDGQSIAYLSRRNADPAVVVIRNAVTSQERVWPLAGPLAFGMALQWSSDGDLLVRAQQDGQLYRLNPQTGQRSPFMSVKFLDTSAGSYKRVATLAPDGKTVYYGRKEAGANTWVIRRVDTESGIESEVSRLERDGVSGIAVSRDGTRLAVSTQRTKAPGVSVAVVTTVRLATGEAVDVCELPAGAESRIPAWSSDGRRLFVPVVSNGNADLWVVPVDGGERRVVRLGLHDLYSIDMSPDGRHLVVMDENYTNELWSIKNLVPTPKKGF